MSFEEFLAKDHELADVRHAVEKLADVTHVGFCTTCRRAWEFNACGDSHYSYAYDVRPFDL
jgi:hypothetical protein